jgi:hypothetical protein
MQISASVNPGNSGGPALNDRGEVIGMVTLKAVDKEGLAFAVPASQIERAVESVQRRSLRKLAEIDQKHMAGAVFLRLDFAGRAYLLLVMNYVEGVREALANGATEVEEVEPYLPDISEQVAEVRSTVGKNLGRYLAMIERASWMDPPSRETLLDFHQIVMIFESRAMNRDVLSVIRAVKEFDHLFNRFEMLGDRLRERFDLPASEDD